MYDFEWNESFRAPQREHFPIAFYGCIGRASLHFQFSFFRVQTKRKLKVVNSEWGDAAAGLVVNHSLRGTRDA